MYRDMVRRGGIPWTPFLKWVLLGVPGRGRQEDVPTLAYEHEFHDEFWATKLVDFSKIVVPSYILGSYSTSLHTMGAIRAFNETNTDKKWLRIHPHQEWYEDYFYQSVDDLDRFFTRYLKGEENGWEATPKVRVSLLRFGETVSSPSLFSTDSSVSCVRPGRDWISNSPYKIRQIVPYREKHSLNVSYYYVLRKLPIVRRHYQKAGCALRLRFPRKNHHCRILKTSSFHVL